MRRYSGSYLWMLPQKWTCGQTDKHTHRWTFWLIEIIGAEGQCFENDLPMFFQFFFWKLLTPLIQGCIAIIAMQLHSLFYSFVGLFTFRVFKKKIGPSHPFIYRILLDPLPQFFWPLVSVLISALVEIFSVWSMQFFSLFSFIVF